LPITLGSHRWPAMLPRSPSSPRKTSPIDIGVAHFSVLSVVEGLHFQRTAHFPFRLPFLDDVSAIAFFPAAHEGDFGFHAPALSVQAERDCSQSSGLELPDEGGNLSAMQEELARATLIIVGWSILRLPWRDGGVREPEFRTSGSRRSAKGDEGCGDIRPARLG